MGRKVAENKRIDNEKSACRDGQKCILDNAAMSHSGTDSLSMV
jgi:hypothetical protein